MKQLLSINDSIQKLSKKKGDKSRARRMTRKISRKPTLAEITDEEQTFSRRDEITLLTNIKVWKYSQSDESSSGSESDLLSEWTFCCSIKQRIPQHNEGLSPLNWCNRLLILDKSVWRENSDRILKMRTSSDIRYVIISRAWFLSRRPSLTKVGFRIEGGWQWIRGVVGLSAVQSQF